MRRTLSPPLPLAPIQRVFTLMLELSEPLESLHGFTRHGDIARRESSSPPDVRSMMRDKALTISGSTSATSFVSGR